MHGLGSAEYRSDKYPLHDKIESLEREVERLKATERFLRSERPMARKLDELEKQNKMLVNFLEMVKKEIPRTMGEFNLKLLAEDIDGLLATVKESK